ncbi:proteophosphoglycan 5 [Rhodotorula toruloides]|uniref:Proteophosphoglycan 5 n=1 Tax=Rhodotorula toruloides TaxID=5286 RepID=A0A511KK52_RHOTO|nr:proteophosphoglycan 5 [Rhodotorula toruloides]
MKAVESRGSPWSPTLVSFLPLMSSSPAGTTLRKARSVFNLSPRLESSDTASAADEGFFSWTRWYGQAKEPMPPTTPAEDVLRMVRDALRRRRETEESESSRSSTSSARSDAWLDSPASSSATFETSATEASEAVVRSKATGYSQEELDALPSLPYSPFTSLSPHLRGTASAATLKTPRVLRRVASSTSISEVPVELPPRSPHASAPTVFPSPTIDASWPPAFPLSLPEPEFSPPPSLRSRLASSLRKSVSSATLRNPFSAFVPTSDSSVQSAAAMLRDLLIKHDAVTDPSAEPLPPLFDPSLDRGHGAVASDDDDEETEAMEVQEMLLEQRAQSSSSSNDSDDDPFSASAPTSVAWMASSPTSSTFTPSRHTYDTPDDVFDSPSSAFPPFDPFAFDLHAPPPAPAVSPAHRRAKVITKQRSFIDPRTCQLRTVPKVTLTPSTPEKPRFH